MENEKKLNEMSVGELVDIILDNPDRMDEIFRATDDLQALYEALQNEIYPDSIVFDDSEMNHNLIIRRALETLSKNYVLDEHLDYEGEELPLITDADLRDAEDELEDFYSKNPELDDRPDSQIPEGMSINEFGEIIRTGKQEEKTTIPPEVEEWLNGGSSPLKKREEQLSALEKEAQTIAKAEALIDKQSAKEGQSIGE